MRFPYQGYPVRGRGGQFISLVWRPIVSIRVIGPAGAEDLPGLVDTGADDTILPNYLPFDLGIEVDEDDEIEALGGQRVAVSFGTVDFELVDPATGTSVRWSARVAFSHGYTTVYGHTGFLDHFSALFNGRTRELSLVPNGTAPDPVYL